MASCLLDGFLPPHDEGHRQCAAVVAAQDFVMPSLVRQEPTSQAQKLLQKVVRDCRWRSDWRSEDDRRTSTRLRAVLATALPSPERYALRLTGGVH